MLNKGNQVTVPQSSVIKLRSDSVKQKVTVPSVPVPQHCFSVGSKRQGGQNGCIIVPVGWRWGRAGVSWLYLQFINSIEHQ